jgi:GTP-binding protein
LPPADLPDENAAAPGVPVQIAIVGRPNVGKSSLTNAILHDERTLVSEISGTTRDAIDIPYERHGNHYVLIDTAGIRPRGKVDSSVEVFSVMRSESSIRRADLCLLVIDATAGVTAQDKKIAGQIKDARKPCVVAVNKWI